MNFDTGSSVAKVLMSPGKLTHIYNENYLKYLKGRGAQIMHTPFSGSNLHILFGYS